MAFNPMAPPHGGHAPAQAGEQKHNQASNMAFAAQRRVRVARALGGNHGPSLSAPQSAPAGQDYRHHVAVAVAPMGIQIGPQHVHAAVDQLTQAGRFTPFQGAALKAHKGPLHGPAGAKTVHDLAVQVATNRAHGVM